MFAERLKKAMVDAGITQAELSRASGVGRSSISQYLAGKNEPEPERLSALAEALGIGPEDLGGAQPIRPSAPRIERLTIREAAQIMGVAHETVKQGLIQGVFPWGYAIQTSADHYTYFINKQKFYEVEGLL